MNFHLFKNFLHILSEYRLSGFWLLTLFTVTSESSRWIIHSEKFCIEDWSCLKKWTQSFSVISPSSGRYGYESAKTWTVLTTRPIVWMIRFRTELARFFFCWSGAISLLNRTLKRLSWFWWLYMERERYLICSSWMRFCFSSSWGSLKTTFNLSFLSWSIDKDIK